MTIIVATRGQVGAGECVIQQHIQWNLAYLNLKYLAARTIFRPQSLRILFNVNSAHGAKYRLKGEVTTRRCGNFYHPKPKEAEIR